MNADQRNSMRAIQAADYVVDVGTSRLMKSRDGDTDAEVLLVGLQPVTHRPWLFAAVFLFGGAAGALLQAAYHASTYLCFARMF